MAAIDEQLIEQIRELAWEGLSSREIAQQLGVGRSTVQKYAMGLLRPPQGGKKKVIAM